MIKMVEMSQLYKKKLFLTNCDLQVINFKRKNSIQPLLAMIALLAVQSFSWVLIYYAALFVNISTMFGTTKVIS